jgi:cyclohexanone monooxygenase
MADTTDAELTAERPDAARELGFDPDALREKYRIERDKRLRADGNQQYQEIKGEFAHYLDDPYVERVDRAPLSDEVDVVVVGGGFGGLLAGARLREAGIKDIRLIEKGGDFGGTWYWNRYPGAACDVESYIYLPLLEEIGYLPVEKYSRAPEILAHSRAIGRYFNLYENACFQTEVTEMRWEEASARWIVSTNRGDAMKARFVVMANGPLHRPKLPGIPGGRNLQGPFLPHQPLGLRLYRRRLERWSGRAEGQAGRHHRHRRNGGAVRAAPGRGGQGTLRFPAHAILHRRAGQPADRPGLGQQP